MQWHNVHDGVLNAAVHNPVLYAMLRVCVYVDPFGGKRFNTIFYLICNMFVDCL